MIPSNETVLFEAAPISNLVRPERPGPEEYFGLLLDPVGLYGQCPYGNSTAYTLRGSELFCRRAFNLFSSFGSNSGSRELTLHNGVHSGSWFICMTENRVKTALRRYFYSQLYKAKGECEPSEIDDEGNVLDTRCLNDDFLISESNILAESFYHYEIPIDYRTVGRSYSTVPVDNQLNVHLPKVGQKIY